MINICCGFYSYQLIFVRYKEVIWILIYELCEKKNIKGKKQKERECIRNDL